MQEEKKGLSRREFLSGTAMTAAAAAAMAATAAIPGVAEASTGSTHDRTTKSWAVKAMVRRRTVNPHTMSPAYQRFDQKFNLTQRPGWDETVKFMSEKSSAALKELQAKNAPGYGSYDTMLNAGASVIASQLGTGINVPDSGLTAWKPLNANFKAPPKLEIKDLADHTARIKKMAIAYGASDVGCCNLDMNWVYSNHWKGSKTIPMNLPDGVKYAIVMAFEMDRDMIATAPTQVCQAETGIAYSKVAATVACLAEAIRSIGYTAVPSMNDTALSVPMAIDAGLGEQGRMGILIHPKFGPRIRLGKVLTDMPIQADAPIEFGVRAFCENCKKCATTCPAKAIPMEGGWTDKNPTISENPGIMKWHINHELCRANGWSPNGTNCTVCISVCPYNKSDGWLHDTAKFALAKAPFLGSTVARMDDLMAYGEQADPNEWWKKEE